MKKTIMLAVAACVLTIFWISSVFAENAATNFKKICSLVIVKKEKGKNSYVRPSGIASLSQ